MSFGSCLSILSVSVLSAHVFLQGVGGTIQFPKDYLRRAYEVVRESGGLCVADEVRLCTDSCHSDSSLQRLSPKGLTTPPGHFSFLENLVHYVFLTDPCICELIAVTGRVL